MDDEYNVLGNFENLNSARILKHLTAAPVPFETSSPDSFSLNGDDLFPDIERTVSPKKRAKNVSKTETDSSINTATNNEFNENIELPRRTRRTRLSMSNKVDVTQPPDCPNSNSKNKRTTRRSTINASNSLAGPSDTTVSNTTVGSKRRGRPKRNSNTTIATDVTDVANNESSTESQLNSSRRGTRSSSKRNVMSARRQYMSELAARCTTVDVVDLLTSPSPRVNGVINLDLDSDNEDIHLATKDENSLDLSFDDDNPEISVKIVWQGKAEIFSLRKYQKFSILFEQLAKREKIEVDKIFLNLNNQILTPNDSPASINYKIYNFIDGRIMSNTKFATGAATNKKKLNPNLITLKVQSDKWKRPLSLELLKTDRFKKLVIKCSEELKMPCQDIKLSFDGETLQYDQTPNDLEFEGGEVLEIHLKK